MNAHDTILAALRALSGVCNGARNEDGQGFNKVNSAFGKELASKDSLTINQQKAALKMLRKYNGQLAGFGIELPKEVVEPICRAVITASPSWYVIRFTEKPNEFTLDEMKAVASAKYYPEKGKAWVLPSNNAAVELVQAWVDFGFCESITAVEPTRKSA